MRVGIVGGTGPFGRALAARLRDAGDEVTIGSRDAERGRERGAKLGVDGGTNEEAARGAELVVLATQSGGAVDTARGLADAIGSTPVLCVASELTFTDAGVLPGRDSRSLAEELAGAIAAPVAAGLHSVSAVDLARPELLDEDALVCGDDPRAKELALELAGKLVSGRALDAGPLANARALEAMTAVILNVNRRFRAHAGLRITGLP